MRQYGLAVGVAGPVGQLVHHAVQLVGEQGTIACAFLDEAGKLGLDVALMRECCLAIAAIGACVDAV